MYYFVSKTRVLNAAVKVFRTKGYTATRVDDLCAEVGLTKGGFFHYFKSKEDVALAALAHWTTGTAELFAGASFQSREDPLERLLGYIELRKALLDGTLPEITCLAGTLAQETFDENPTIRAACGDSIRAHVSWLGTLITEAKHLHAPEASWEPASVAMYTQAVVQGAFVLAKATADVGVARDCIDHLRAYVASLFPRAAPARRGS
jgi:TetR/AcrR family transcriptional regulator, transcriptional repressor for nem operon